MSVRKLICVASFPLLACISSLSDACVATYMDYSVNTTTGEVEAWSWVEDYFDEGYCLQQAYYQWYYWEHSYHASVYIESPGNNSVFDFSDMSNVPYGGGNADAYASMFYLDDPGQYYVRMIIWIFCTVIGDIFVNEDVVEFVDATSSGTCSLDSTDQAATGAVLIWPIKEAWERGVSMFCGGPNVHLFGFYGDSFGYFYGGFGATNDPCKVGILNSQNQVAFAHSHPWFNNSSEFNAGLGCHNDQSYWSAGALNTYNTITNTSFSTDDLSVAGALNKPSYLRIPAGTQVKRYWPPAPGPSVQVVYP